MEIVEDFLAGWIGGVAGLIIGHPADTVKVRQQSMNESFLKTFTTTYKYEGFFGFYKGCFAPFLTIGPSNAAFFCVYGSCLRQLQQQSVNTSRVDLNHPHWLGAVLISAGLGGFVQVIITCPVELIKTIQQTHTDGGKWASHYQAPYSNSLEAFKGILHNHGIAGLFRGLVPMFWRDVPSSGIYMSVYESLASHSEDQPLWQQIGAGGLSGVASWILTVPFDAVKTRLQSDDPANPKYKGMVDCFYKTYAEERNLRIFMKGFWLITARAFPVNAAILLAYETVSRMFKKLHAL